MTRVALGHTGRAITAHPLINTAFVLLNVAALARVFPPLITDAHYAIWIHLSGGLWALSLALFFIHYLPILTRPRIDGAPG